MRKLASIRTVKEIRPIEGADAIECVVVDGWNVVSKKGEFAAGDTCVYFEIDSLLPEIEVFEFLRKSSYVKSSENGAGFRLKTIRLRGQYSQGLVIKPKEIVDSNPKYKNILTAEVGDDISSILDVKLWEPIVPAQLGGQVHGYFPSFMPKTDQERVQNIFDELLPQFKDHTWEVTMKVDGSSGTCYYNKEFAGAGEEQFGVCSRNLRLKRNEANSFWKVAYTYEVERKLKELNRNIAIQGELMGPGVQGNREKFGCLKWLVFDMYDIDAQRYLSSVERVALCEQLDLDHVPVIDGEMDLSHITKIEEILELAEMKSINKEIEAEGVVFKSLKDPNVSFKAISNRFLVKQK